MNDCAQYYQAMVNELDRSFACREEGGATIIRTPLVHHDGDAIEVNLVFRGDALFLSDFAQTLDRIESAGFEFTDDRRETIATMIGDYGAELDGYEIRLRIVPSAAPGAMIWRFAQVVSNVSALAYRQSASETGAFRKTVQARLSHKDVPVFDGFTQTIIGNYHGRNYKRHLKFPLAILQEHYPVLLVAGDTKAVQRAQVNNVFRIWTEYRQAFPTKGLTIINDTAERPQLASLSVLEKVSPVVTLSQLEEFPAEKIRELVVTAN